jgi:signal transduction histidine kinase/DNA-binding response OmpR family regulator
MADAVAWLQNISAAAFVLLGAATAASWLRRRDPATGFLALAIVLLSSVTLLARLPAVLHMTPPLLEQLDLVLFMGSGYALLRFRGSLIPLPHRWHAGACISMLAASGLFFAAQVAGSTGAIRTLGLVLIAIWSASVVEPTARFWLVARKLPGVQAWRLRTLALGFAGLVAILLFAVAAGAFTHQPLVQIVTQVIALAIVPLLYVSFSPPAWLRREWRAGEEEGLRAFMEQLLLEPDHDGLVHGGLGWAERLVGGAASAMFDDAGNPKASHRLEEERLVELASLLPGLADGVVRARVDDTDRTLLVLRVAGLASFSTMVIVAGPFTPAMGGDEVRRAQQFASAFMTALDRRRLMEQLRDSNQKLQEASKHKSMFLANMSHELRTPLNAIIGFSELLSDAMPEQFDDATRRRFLSQIVTSGKHLLSLINDILDLSKVEAGQMELRIEAVSIPEVVEQVMRTVEPLVAKKGIELQADAAGGGMLRADTGKVKQMLLNLVSNAIKFTPEGGSITISAARAPRAVQISVADSGIGIAEADQAQIFQEFHQVDGGPGRRHEGTGLGLALTRRFAALHGGDVKFRSKVGRGSVFTLTLPLEPARAERESQPVVAGVQANGHGPLVLVVEDEPSAAELLTRQLANAGYRTAVARTGTEALAKAKELKPAAITLDIILPGLDGWEVMTRLKGDPGTAHIPIVVVSVLENPELGMALGAMDYLVKPVDMKVLISRLKAFAPVKERLQVLVVDDEEANREWLVRALEPAGFDVLSASSGKRGIALARSRKPDLVLLDLMMPEVNGFDVVEALRTYDSTRHTPILILTAATLSDKDKRKLNGQVSEILSRGKVGSSLIVDHLRTVAQQSGVR